MFRCQTHRLATRLNRLSTRCIHSDSQTPSTARTTSSNPSSPELCPTSATAGLFPRQFARQAFFGQHLPLAVRSQPPRRKDDGMNMETAKIIAGPLWKDPGEVSKEVELDPAVEEEVGALEECSWDCQASFFNDYLPYDTSISDHFSPPTRVFNPTPTPLAEPVPISIVPNITSNSAVSQLRARFAHSASVVPPPDPKPEPIEAAQQEDLQRWMVEKGVPQSSTYEDAMMESKKLHAKAVAEAEKANNGSKQKEEKIPTTYPDRALFGKGTVKEMERLDTFLEEGVLHEFLKRGIRKRISKLMRSKTRPDGSTVGRSLPPFRRTPPTKIESPSSVAVEVEEIGDGAIGNEPETIQALNMIQIRRKKMNKHKLKKRRKAMRRTNKHNREKRKHDGEVRKKQE